MRVASAFQLPVNEHRLVIPAGHGVPGHSAQCTLHTAPPHGGPSGYLVAFANHPATAGFQDATASGRHSGHHAATKPRGGLSARPLRLSVAVIVVREDRESVTAATATDRPLS